MKKYFLLNTRTIDYLKTNLLKYFNVAVSATQIVGAEMYNSAQQLGSVVNIQVLTNPDILNPREPKSYGVSIFIFFFFFVNCFGLKLIQYKYL